MAVNAATMAMIRGRVSLLITCIMFLHYPPTNILERRSGFTDMAEEYGAEQVIYAHCHGQSRFHDSIEGRFHGVEYRLVSGDYLVWKPAWLSE